MRTFSVCALLIALNISYAANSQPLPNLDEPAQQMGELIQTLEQHTEVVTLGEPNSEMLVILPDVGAIVLGAAPGGVQDWNLLWATPKIKDAAYWEKPGSLIGGVRTNIAPQWGGPRHNLIKTGYRGSVSGGRYQVKALSAREAVLDIPFHLKSDAGYEYRGIVTRTIALLPEDETPEPAGVWGVGFSITHTLSNTGGNTWGQDADPIGLWYIGMVAAGGTGVAPITPGSEKAWRDYTSGGQGIPLDRVGQSDESVVFKADGKYISKIGTTAKRTRPFAAYLRHTHGDPGLLMITQFLIDPAARYVDRPRNNQTGIGDIVQFYTGDGSKGHYLEVENHSPAMNLAPGESQSHTTNTWLWTGPMAELKALATRTMTIDMDQVPYFK
jgi:hypothetical protein